jgi:hypothetical protein
MGGRGEDNVLLPSVNEYLIDTLDDRIFDTRQDMQGTLGVFDSTKNRGKVFAPRKSLDFGRSKNRQIQSVGRISSRPEKFASVLGGSKGSKGCPFVVANFTAAIVSIAHCSYALSFVFGGIWLCFVCQSESNCATKWY